MLSATDNELLTRVGARTPMGNLLREYWIPFLFSWEVESNGSPERVRLLGEDLLAIRDSSGKPGLIAERCPHRGASLYFGRNEKDGLRCIYHGWKFDVAGRCVDMPSEPPDSNFQWKVRTVSYPVVERAGMIWAYMGSKDEPPPLPALEWLGLPEDHIVASKRMQYSNWVQGMEGDLDQSHVSFVHSRLRLDSLSPRAGVDAIRHYDTHPRFQVVETDYGVCIGSGRETPDGERYWRISQHLMPFHTMTGPYGDNPTRNWRAWVPIDDENVFVIGVTFHPTRPFTGEQRENLLTKAGVWNISPENRAPVSSAPFGRWRPALSIENDFHQDRGDAEVRDLLRYRRVLGAGRCSAAQHGEDIRPYARASRHVGSRHHLDAQASHPYRQGVRRDGRDSQRGDRTGGLRDQIGRGADPCRRTLVRLHDRAAQGCRW